MDHKLDLNSLSVDDIIEEYKTLHERHQQLKEQCEEDAQRIHELKRSLDTAHAAEAYLTQELEQLGAQPQSTDTSTEPRIQQELDDLRRKYNNLQLDHETLQQDFDLKVEESAALKVKYETAVRALELNAAAKANSAHDEYATRFNMLEQDNAELLQKLEEYQETSVRHTFIVAEKEKTIEILQDQVGCLEENLRFKRDELEEKLQLLESAQEQVVEANARIAQLTSAPENDRKGNSLFAEVDDQRQVMKHLFEAQKKSYLQMKKEFNDSKYEIHRLKRENIAMHTELQACSTIFCSADKTFHNQMNKRVRQLLNQNDRLERQLTLTQERLRELANEKSVIWFDSMLDFCKYELPTRETDELKAELHSMRIQKASMEEQLRNMQQDMARWRFEALKSRCVLIDREYLLTENKISFKLMQAMEFNIKEAELQAALPRIALPKTDSPAAIVAVKNASIVLDMPIKPKAEVENLDEIVQEPQLLAEESTLVNIPMKPSPGHIKVKPESVLCAEPFNQVEPEEITHPSDIKLEMELNQELVIKPNGKATPVKLAKVKKLYVEPCESAEVVPTPIKQEPTELVSKPLRKGTPVKLAKLQAETELADSDCEIIELLTPAKPQRKGTPIKLKIKQQPMEDCPAISPAKPQRKGTPVKPIFANISDAAMTDKSNRNVRSILSKERDIFAEDTKKMVHFTSNEPTVHEMSAQLSVNEEEEQQQSTECSKENEQPAVQTVKPKSNNIIRRIIMVGSKKPVAATVANKTTK